MQTMVRPLGVLAIGGGSAWSRSATTSCGCPCDRLPAAECGSVRSSSIVLDARGWSKLRLRAADRRSGSSSSSCDRLHRFRVRAEKNADDVAKDIGSNKGAVESGGESASVDKAADLILVAQDAEDKANEGAQLDTSASSVPDAPFFKDVEVPGSAKSAESAAGSVESTGSVSDVPGSEGELSRSQAQQKLVETAKDGIEVLKWAAEGVRNAGKSATKGLEVAKGLVDKRLKSFSVAADDTKEVSSQFAEGAQKEFEKLQGSASKFGEEFQVNVDDKKASDSLKPESEASPLTKLGSEIQENVAKATSEDGPIKDLSDTLSEGISKVKSAGQKAAEKGQEIASIASKKGEEIAAKAKEISSSAEKKAGDAEKDIKSD